MYAAKLESLSKQREFLFKAVERTFRNSGYSSVVACTLLLVHSMPTARSPFTSPSLTDAPALPLKMAVDSLIAGQPHNPSVGGRMETIAPRHGHAPRSLHTSRIALQALDLW